MEGLCKVTSVSHLYNLISCITLFRFSSYTVSCIIKSRRVKKIPFIFFPHACFSQSHFIDQNFCFPATDPYELQPRFCESSSSWLVCNHNLLHELGLQFWWQLMRRSRAWAGLFFLGSNHTAMCKLLPARLAGEPAVLWKPFRCVSSVLCPSK